MIFGVKHKKEARTPVFRLYLLPMVNLITVYFDMQSDKEMRYLIFMLLATHEL